MKQFIRKQKKPVLQERYIINEDGSKLRYLTFPKLDEISIVSHGMTTREGGVSVGCYESMNLSYTRGDNPDHVSENYQRMMKVLGVDKSRAVTMDQKHTDVVRVVKKEDAGKGVTRELDFSYVDGQVTNEKNMPLLVFASDCVPVFFVDPVHQAIGVCHSGWRGTVKRISRNLIETMKKEYGTEPKDLICAIGPSICRDCYEISEDVALKLMEEFSGHKEEILVDDGFVKVTDQFSGRTTDEHKYHLDLWQTNRVVLEDAGVLPENIDVTDMCTYCNPDLLFSHRRSGGHRGNNTGFLMLK